MIQRHQRPARIPFAWLALLASVAVLIALVGLLAWDSWRGPTAASKRPLIVYCAAGLRPPVEAAAQAYQQEYGVQVQLQYGGSQTLLANIEASQRGDLYLPADDSYLRMARDKGLVARRCRLARMTPVLAVPKGNPKNLHSLDDLTPRRRPLGPGQPGGRGRWQADSGSIAEGRHVGRPGKARRRDQADGQRRGQRRRCSAPWTPASSGTPPSARYPELETVAVRRARRRPRPHRRRRADVRRPADGRPALRPLPGGPRQGIAALRAATAISRSTATPGRRRPSCTCSPAPCSGPPSRRPSTTFSSAKGCG